MASPGYGVPTVPQRKTPGGLNFLQDDKLKQAFRKDLIELVRVAPPRTLGVAFVGDQKQACSDYVDALINLLETKPYLIAELDKTNRISYANFTKTDKQWVRQVLVEETRNLRFRMDDTAFKSRLAPNETQGWLEFRTIDCVFAAILAALGFRPTANRVDVDKLKVKDKQQHIENAERLEREAEDWLAQQLNFVRRVTPDAALIFVLEVQFGWKRVSDGALVSAFKSGKAAPSSFILSYQRNGDDWHTVYLDHPNTSTWTVIDRQGTALGISTVNDNGLCDAWQVDAATPGFITLQTAWNNR